MRINKIKFAICEKSLTFFYLCDRITVSYRGAVEHQYLFSLMTCEVYAHLSGKKQGKGIAAEVDAISQNIRWAYGSIPMRLPPSVRALFDDFPITF